MAVPEKWLWQAIESAAQCSAYPIDIPAGDPPYVVFRRTATTRAAELADTLSEEPTPDAMPPSGTFQLEVYADGYLAVKDLADAIRSALHRYAGSVDGLTIESSFLVDESDSDPIYLDGREKPTYLIEQTYTITWQE